MATTEGDHESILWSFAEEHLTCSICYELFNTPKTLACLHSFCENCLQQSHEGYSGEIVCPVCRQADSASHLQGVESLTTDFKLVGMVETVRKEDKQIAPSCSRHEGKPCRVYCQTCDELLCLNCLAGSNDHSDHLLEEVREAVPEKRQAVKDHMPEYQTFMEEITEALNKTKLLEGEFFWALDRTRKDVEKQAEKEIAKVNAAKNKLLAEIQQFESQRKERFAANELELTVMQNTLQEIIEQAGDAIKESNDYDFLQKYPILSNGFYYVTNSNLPSIGTNASLLKFYPDDCGKGLGSVSTHELVTRPPTVPYGYDVQIQNHGWSGRCVQQTESQQFLNMPWAGSTPLAQGLPQFLPPGMPPGKSQGMSPGMFGVQAQNLNIPSF